jgi:hypothetical protein
MEFMLMMVRQVNAEYPPIVRVTCSDANHTVPVGFYYYLSGGEYGGAIYRGANGYIARTEGDEWILNDFARTWIKQTGTGIGTPNPTGNYASADGGIGTARVNLFDFAEALEQIGETPTIVAGYAAGQTPAMPSDLETIQNYLDGTAPIAAASLVNVPAVPADLAKVSDLAAIKAKTDLITANNIRVISPLVGLGKIINLVIGDDYKKAHGRAIKLESDDYPDLAGVSCFFRVIRKATSELMFFAEGEVLDARTLQYEITRAQTSLLEPLEIGEYIYSSRVVFSDGDIATEKVGQVLVLIG